jgi:transcriptional repressor NrdR
MECPYCGKNDDKVIDSRLSKDGIAIRRRRECLVCSRRFTTYETMEEQLLPFLMRKMVEGKATTTNLKNLTFFMSNTFKDLGESFELLIDKMDKLEKAQAAEEAKISKHRAAAKIRAKKKVGVKKPPAPKARRLTDSAHVLKIIKRHKRGIDLKKLRERTGFQDNKISVIVSRAYKKGKIKKVSRGVYAAP